ncbi:hypothetical protein BJ546DRAFT_139633 [Cryomyces antarcticus]
MSQRSRHNSVTRHAETSYDKLAPENITAAVQSPECWMGRKALSVCLRGAGSCLTSMHKLYTQWSASAKQIRTMTIPCKDACELKNHFLSCPLASVIYWLRSKSPKGSQEKLLFLLWCNVRLPTNRYALPRYREVQGYRESPLRARLAKSHFSLLAVLLAVPSVPHGVSPNRLSRSYLQDFLDVPRRVLASRFTLIPSSVLS